MLTLSFQRIKMQCSQYVALVFVGIAVVLVGVAVASAEDQSKHTYLTLSLLNEVLLLCIVCLCFEMSE